MTVAASLQAAAERPTWMLEARDALHRSMLHHLDLPQLAQLAGTCTAWHQLVMGTPLCQLSQEVHQQVSPSGLTSSHPLLEVLEQQVQLLGQLRGSQRHAIRVQPVSFSEAASRTVHPRHRHEASRRGPQVQFGELIWSPCENLEESSRWTVLQPSHGQQLAPVVIDACNGQQVCFQGEEPASVMASMPAGAADGEPALHAEWLAHDQLVMHPSRSLPNSYPHRPSSVCIRLAAASSGSFRIARLTGLEQAGNYSFFPLGSGSSSVKNVLCWAAKRGMKGSFEGYIIVHDLPSCLPLYQLSCPQPMLNSFLQFHHISISASIYEAGNHEGKHWCVQAIHIMPSPCKKFFGVLWAFELLHGSLVLLPDIDSVLLGVSVHTAADGEHQHSVSLAGGEAGRPATHCWPSWIPGSSNIVTVNTAGLLSCIAWSGQVLWTSSGRRDSLTDPRHRQRPLQEPQTTQDSAPRRVAGGFLCRMRSKEPIAS